MSIQKISYCGAQVRDHDPDRFLLSMVMPVDKREALWALFAFNHEIAKTRELVTETQLGLIRLQWWREALEGIYAPQSTVLEHEVVQALAQAIKAHDLPQQLFKDLLYAREFDLEDRLPASLDGLENYADYTTTPLNRLVLAVLGEGADDESLQAISKAYAMTGLLRAVPYHCGQERCFLPEDLMQAAEIKMNNFYNYKEADSVISVTGAVVEDIQKILSCAPKQKSHFLKASKVMTRIYLKQIKAQNFNVFDPAMARPPAFFHFRFLLGLLF